MANQMDDGDGEDDGEMMYDDEDFDAEQILAQIGLTPEQLQNLTEDDLAQLSEAQIQGIARLQMHQMQQEQQQMHGADGEGMAGDGEEYQDLGQISEAEYMKLVQAEQERLAREQEGMEEEGDDEGLDEEIIGQLQEAFDACDGDHDGALTKVELENLLTSIGG